MHNLLVATNKSQSQPHRVNSPLGPIYTKRQCQCCSDACDIGLFEINGKIELLRNGIATHFGVTPLNLMRAMSQASLQR